MISKLKSLLRRRRRDADFRERGIKVHPLSRLGGHTEIGVGTNINGPAFISCSSDAPVTIGKYCAIAYGLRIRTRNHATCFANLQHKLQKQYGFPDLADVRGPVTIGNNVWIADRVTILSGVRIGDGAVIGAGAVVTRDVPPFSISVGVPARVIKKRFADSVVRQLTDIRWWDWAPDRISRNHEFFSTDFSKSGDVDIHGLIVD